MVSQPAPIEVRAGETPAQRRAAGRPVPLVIAALGFGALLAICVLILLQDEALSWLPAAGAVVGLAGMAWAMDWRQKRIWVVLAADLALIFLYSWSMDESLHVVITGNSQYYLANVDGNQTIQYGRELRGDPTGNGPDRIGLYAGNATAYSVGAFSTTTPPAQNTPLGWIYNVLRFAAPKPAWSDVTLAVNGGPARRIATVQAATGSWSTTGRNEIEGSLGASGYLATLPSRNFKLTANLARPDGLQGVLVGVGDSGFGYMLGIREDHRDVRWSYWNGGALGECTCHRVGRFQPHMINMVKRALRYLLPSAILGIFLLLLAFPAYSASLVGVRAAEPLVQRLSLRVERTRNRLGQWQGQLVDSLAVVIAAIVAVMIAGVAWLSFKGLPTIFDTVAYLFQGRTIASGRLWMPVPHALSFFGFPFVVAEHGHWFGKYPPGWPLLLSVGALFGVPWIINPVVAALGILLIYLVGREIYDRPVALTGIVLAATSPFLYWMGGGYLSHPATWLFLGLFAYLVILTVKRHPVRGLQMCWPGRSEASLIVTAGLALGMAFITRQYDALIFAPPFLFLLLRRPATYVWIGAGFAIPFLFFIAYSLETSGQLVSDGYIRAQPWDRLGFGPSIGGAPGDTYTSDFTPARGVWNLVFNLEHIQQGLLGWPFYLSIAVALIPFVLGRARSWDWLLLSCCITVVTGYLFYWASGVEGGFPRYWYIIMPWLILLVARGLQELCRWMLATTPWRKSRPAAFVLPALFIGALIGFNLDRYLPQTVLNWRNPAAAPVQVVKAAHLHHAIVFQVQVTNGTLDYAEVFNQNPLNFKGNVLWAVDQGARDRVLMQQFPGWSYYRLEGTTLNRIHRGSA